MVGIVRGLYLVHIKNLSEIQNFHMTQKDFTKPIKGIQSPSLFLNPLPHKGFNWLEENYFNDSTKISRSFNGLRKSKRIFLSF
tara:strand:+ start:75 stop:323 length:249 start_codon:yes stop_codon:yes gene_type:complete